MKSQPCGPNCTCGKHDKRRTTDNQEPHPADVRMVTLPKRGFIVIGDGCYARRTFRPEDWR